MAEKIAFLRRMFEALVENRRAAAQRRSDRYLEAIGLIDRRDEK